MLAVWLAHRQTIGDASYLGPTDTFEGADDEDSRQKLLNFINTLGTMNRLDQPPHHLVRAAANRTY